MYARNPKWPKLLESNEADSLKAFDTCDSNKRAETLVTGLAGGLGARKWGTLRSIYASGAALPCGMLTGIGPALIRRVASTLSPGNHVVLLSLRPF